MQCGIEQWCPFMGMNGIKPDKPQFWTIRDCPKAPNTLNLLWFRTPRDDPE
jgi:hypothetical protein